MKKIFTPAILFSVVVSILYFKFYISDKQLHQKLSSKELIDMYENQDGSNSFLSAANIIELNGSVTAIERAALTIDKKIFCKFRDDIFNIKVGDTISLVGKFIGYDDLFKEFKINECSILNP